MNWGMKMAEKERENKVLDALFQAARDAPPTPPDALLSRVLEDAIAVGNVPVAPRVLRTEPTPWRDFLRAVGGWPAMAGLTSAAVAGLWLGVAPPAALPGVANAYLGLEDGSYLVDAAPGFGFDLLEETL